MRYIFLIVLFLHGMIHFIGFVKGFGLKEVRELTLPIPKAMGVIWLIAAMLFFTYSVTFITNYRYAGWVGIVAVLISQFLIIIYWKDAKFGTIPNIMVLYVSIASIGYHNFRSTVEQEIEDILSHNRIQGERIIAVSDIVDLPDPVKTWLSNSGLVGRPHIAIGKVVQKLEMQLDPGKFKWLSANAVQYTTINQPAFIWTVNVKMNGLIDFQGRDKFEKGKGEMLIKVNSLFPVADEKGEQIDEGTMQRFLGEMVWFPSLALSPYVTWEQLNDNTAKATMTYSGITGSGTFYFNSRGDVTRFSALRYRGNEPGAKRYEWLMDIQEYKTFEGIRVPAVMRSTWKLDEGDWTWLKLEITDLKYNQNAVP